MAKRAKRNRGQTGEPVDISENQDGRIIGDDIFNNEEPETYKIYRKDPATGRLEYLDYYNPPMSEQDLKATFGAGLFEIRVLHPDGRIKNKKVVQIAGVIGKPEPEPEIPEIIENIEDRKSILDDVEKLAKIIKLVAGEKNDSSKALADMMAAMTASMTAMNQAIMGIMTSNINMMQQMNEQKQGANTNDLIMNAINEGANIVGRWMEIKMAQKGGQKVVNQEPKQTQAQVTVWDYINEAQKQKTDVNEFAAKIKQAYPMVPAILKGSNFEAVLPILKNMGLQVIDEGYLKNLYAILCG